MLEAWPEGTSIDLGSSLDHSKSWNQLSANHLHAFLKHNVIFSAQTIQASLGSRFPMTNDHLETMLQHAKKSMTFDVQHITDILRTILIHQSQDTAMVGNLVSTLMTHTDNVNFEETLLKIAIQDWNPRHFMESSTHQWVVERITSSIGQDRFIETCHDKVADLILQGHFHLAEQFSAFCPKAWSLKSPVAWMETALRHNLAHHVDPEQAMQALMVRYLGVDPMPEDTVYFYEDLARDYFLRAKQALPPQSDSDNINDAIRQWNQDFATEILRLNQRLESRHSEAVKVFRGISMAQEWHPDMADHFFTYGHLAFKTRDDPHVFFQFAFTPWTPESTDKTWNIVGTYSASNPHTAAHFSMGGFYTLRSSVVFESSLPQGYTNICEPYGDTYQLILPELMPDTIYVLDHSKAVLARTIHPKHQGNPSFAPSFDVGDTITDTSAINQDFHCLGFTQDDHTKPETPDMLDEYYGFPVPESVDQCGLYLSVIDS
jgi:hypothetical protein